VGSRLSALAVAVRRCGRRIGWGWGRRPHAASRDVLIVLGALMLPRHTLAATQIDGRRGARSATAVVFVAMGVTAIGWNGVSLAEVARLAPADNASARHRAATVLRFRGVLLGPSPVAAILSYLQSYAATFGLPAFSL